MENFTQINLVGADAFDYGHRMFSSDIKNLEINSSVLSLFLNAEGRIQHQFWALRKSDGLSLFVQTSRAKGLIQLIEQYHFAEKFILENAGEKQTEWHSLRDGSLNKNGLGSLIDEELVGIWRNTQFKIHTKKPASSKLALNAAQEDWTNHRIHNLIPEFNVDIDESTLVFDPGFEELCHPEKGCYVGQEVVERVRSRAGKGPKVFAALSWKWHPEPLCEIFDAAGNNIGNTTKTILSTGSNWLSLGFIKRSAAQEAAPVHIYTQAGEQISGQIVKLCV